MSRFLLFICFGIAIVLLLTLKLTVKLPPRLDKASVRQLRKKLQPTSPVLIVDTVIDSTRKSLKRNITKIPTTKKIILKKVIQRQNTRKKKPIIAICAATHSTSTWKTLSDTTLQTLMIPSIKKSITTNDKNTYDYLLNMNIRSFTHQRLEDLRKEIEKIEGNIISLKKTSERKLWLKDINKFEKEYLKWNKKK